jgi:hypothetical protein
MQYFQRDLCEELYAVFARNHCPESSQIKLFLEVFGRSVQPYFFPLLSL